MKERPDWKGLATFFNLYIYLFFFGEEKGSTGQGHADCFDHFHSGGDPS
jgi:hypothetical protein